MKKIDIFNHIWPKPFFDRLMADMRVRRMAPPWHEPATAATWTDRFKDAARDELLVLWTVVAAGLLTPERGEVCVAGRRLADLEPVISRNVHCAARCGIDQTTSSRTVGSTLNAFRASD